ncbi:DUF551 domain-containing protein [Enterobacter hormaechei subsp. oharae]|uniref:DUF551 domain-containing protein n=2 Tax=Enterobacter hormaechei TaxID=158836 RepID=UPI00125C6E84|nr:DUF551 domain-containing protein [Enterobacter hormaechei]MCU2373602.1 DUF551 domain-containing protein [Enterobacter hormaechei subsp. oharae]MCU2451246.1 DUF551 domain-containing protein [Enterobacter hormaechei subsp. oharae]MCU2559513.1 DUF551 domain-containing protein [Enterobacter hormaechei subsp. oharae]MCU2886674.1 DUF551 domain-containing protein [Enterobacter hormaechei subsp. oharae]MCU3836437.1 DUF551 domain-containing protein [Enterobacter hormaechei subsp. oharae]
MSNIDKHAVQAVADLKAGYRLGHADVAILNELARIALASLEAEAVCVIDQSNLDYLKSGSDADVWPASRAEMGDVLLYRSATPAPVSVPAAMEMDDDFDSSFEHGKAVGWNAYRAAMLQGADRPQNEPQNIPENIPATQFKPVADLYGLTSPTGGETSFTFDAVEARDFIDGDWLCQEYVELERFQEAITNHTEDKLAMVDHSGDSNNMVESVTTACELRDVVDAIRNSGIAIDGEKILAERDALNSPVIPDGWVACSDRMPEQFKAILAFNEYGEVWSGAYDRYWNFYCDNLLVEHVTHWMPLPNPPKE